MQDKNFSDKILKDLNPEQKSAVTHDSGPLLIVAGAGTGKTTVITRRIAWLILNNLAKSDEILALTFTEKAAQEMEERVDRLLPYGYVDLWVSTFHSFCERILQEHAIDIGLPLNFKLLNETQQCFLVQENFEKFNLDYYRPLGNPTRFIQSLVKHFSRAKDELINPEDYLEYAENLKTNKDSIMSSQNTDQEVSRLEEIANAYHLYQQLLLENNALDFGDLINYTLKLFEKRPAILEKYQRQFKYILVDEFQDTNWAQYKLLQLLIGAEKNITVVFDDDQSIYLWRGASYNNALQFKKDYPESTQVVLVNNYRSGQKILDLAYNFIQLNNPERLEAQDKRIIKKLKTKININSEIEYFHFKTQEDEARFVVKKIMELKRQDKEATWNDFVILIRANNQAENFIQVLNLAGVPNQFLARAGLFTKPVIIDILSYLKLLDNYHESSAVYRLLISPIFYQKISNDDLARLTNFANKKSWSLFEAIQKANLIPQITQKTVEQLNIFLSWVEKHSDLAKKEPVSKIIYAFLEDSNYLKILSDQENSVEIFSWLNQFFKKVENFEAINFDKSIKNFTRIMDLMLATGDTGSIETGVEEGPEAVKVSTIHGAKGLEFKYVFIVNLVDKRFPTIERHEVIELPRELLKEIIPQGDIHLQEERRLFYVALTRAKQGLYLTSAEDYGGKTIKKPSRFLYELGLVEERKEAKKIDFEILKSLKVEEKEKRVLSLPLMFSFSQLKAFETCPLQYKFAFILNIPRRGRFVFSFGKSLHNTLLRFCQQWKEKSQMNQKSLFNQKTKDGVSGRPKLEDLLEIYNQSWIDEWYESKAHQEKYKEKGKEALKMFYEDFVKSEPRIKYLEKSFNFTLNKYIIKGIIDRVDETKNGYEIIDYKTGANGGKEFRQEDKQQLLIYQLAGQQLIEIFDKPISQLTFYYLETGQRVSFLGSDDELKKMEEKIIRTIEEIKKGDFSPHPSRMCQFCDFFNICQYRQE